MRVAFGIWLRGCWRYWGFALVVEGRRANFIEAADCECHRIKADAIVLLINNNVVDE